MYGSTSTIANNSPQPTEIGQAATTLPIFKPGDRVKTPFGQNMMVVSLSGGRLSENKKRWINRYQLIPLKPDGSLDKRRKPKICDVFSEPDLTKDLGVG